MPLHPKDFVRLAILLLALPDPNQKLFIQTIHEFHLFPKLPPELRAMIWSFTFPPGRQFHYFGDVACIGLFTSARLRKPKFVPPPIAHRITRESRSEVLDHYSWVSRTFKSGDNEQLYPCKRSFFFNRSRDTIMSPLIAVFKSEIGASDLINYFGKHDEMELAALSAFLPHLRTLDLVQLFSLERRLTFFHVPHTSLLQYCSGLENIRIAGLVSEKSVESPIDPGALTATELKIRADAILRYFKERNAEDPTFRIPSITLHHVYAYETYGKQYAHRRMRQHYPMGNLFVPPKKSDPN